MLERVCRHARSFEVIHFHTDGLHLPVVQRRQLGRIAPEKGVERAVAIARRSESPLKIAAKIDRADQDYFNSRIARLIDGSEVDFIGEITEVEKTRFLGEAIALLFPIDWPEPFGLTIPRARGLSRKRCRERFEQRFQVAQMSQAYCNVYELARQQTCPVMS